MRIFLHIGVFEYTTYNNTGTNGETEFHHVMKKMLPNANGNSISTIQASVQQTVNQTYTFNGSYTLPPNAGSPVNHNSEHTVEEFTDLCVAVWIQDETTKEVFQSTTGTLITGINNQNGQLLSAKVYPNPVVDQASIAFYLKQEGDVKISIFNILGEQISEISMNNLSSGRSVAQLNTSELSAGMYSILLSANDESIVKKLQIHK